jgi:Flp pilus assembly protein TadB
MDEERVGIELIVSVIAWFAVVLLAFFFVGAVAGVIAILLGALLLIWWLVRAIRPPEKRQ